LYKYILPSTDFTSALEYWRGHERKNQDFVFPNGNVEVKTSTQKQHAKVYISNEKQLDNSGISNLFLYCLLLNEPVQSGYSLSGIVNMIYELLKGVPNANLKFRDFLLDAGYLDEHKEQYAIPVYSINDEYFFKITEEFPRIIKVPDGIGDVKYSINLSSCTSFSFDIIEGILLLKRVM